MNGGIFDPGSWRPLASSGELSIETGVAEVHGHRAAAAVFRFDRHAGTIGLAEADRLIALVRHAVVEGLPLVALVRSGGIRMQEGAEPFTRLVALARSLRDLRAAGLPFVVHVGDPATGGALVGIAAQAQLVLAEPGALVTLVGPKAHGRDVRAERLLELGQIDGIVSEDELPGALGRFFGVLAPRSDREVRLERSTAAPPEALVGWEAVRASRERSRSTLRGVLDLTRSATVLRGDRVSADDESVLAAICELAGQPCIVVAGSLADDQAIGLAGLRKAARAFAIAGELHLPVVSLVDVSGPKAPSEGEWAGLQGAVADSLAALHAADVPSVGVMVGSGSGAAALALLGARRVIAVPGSWLAPLSPEQSAAILQDDPGAAAAADLQRVSSSELQRAGWVDEVVTDDPEAIVAAVGERLRG